MGVDRFVRTRQEMLSPAVRVLAPLGWATYGTWRRDETGRIVRLADSGASDAEIDRLVTELWNTTSSVMFRNIATPLRRYGRGIDHEFQRRNFQRGNLIDEAVACHFAGHYGGATLLTYAQIDGLTRDVTGSSFFSGSNVKYVDDSTLAGIEGNLPVVRRFFGEPVETTDFHSKVSRHGASHGRDISFASRVTSTKALVLLGALTEYLESRADEAALKMRRERELAARGRTGADINGRMLDDRHLDQLYFFMADLDAKIFSEACLSGGLSAPDEWINDAYQIMEERRLSRRLFTWGLPTSDSYWWFYRTPSGQYLGAAARRYGSGLPVDWRRWHWDAPSPPTASPWESSEGWRVFDGNDSTPNWTINPFPIGE